MDERDEVAVIFDNGWKKKSVEAAWLYAFCYFLLAGKAN